MTEFEVLSKKFYELDKAMGGLKGVIAAETGDAIVAKRAELDQLQDKANEALAAVREKKAEIESLVAEHPMAKKFADLKEERRAVVAALQKMTGKEEWWK